MAEPIKTDIAKNPDWWAEWFAADYSWEGLARMGEDGEPVHPWLGWVVVDEAQCLPKDDAPEDADPSTIRAATLQDYWRADPDNDWRLRSEAALRRAKELTSTRAPFAGKHWHIAHLPPADPNGEETSWKADFDDDRWSALQRVLQVRMDAGAETRVHLFGVTGPDRRAQLKGCVLCQALPAPQAEASLRDVRADQSAHVGDSDYGGAQWGAGTDFNRASFSGAANFSSASFSDYANFISASFSDYANFQSASFSDFANFSSASFSDYANFQSASFSDYADFQSTSFSDFANFISASFSDYADFQSASFSGSADFESASFSGYAYFIRASFAGNAYFYSASFSGYADFHSASFLRDLNLERGSAPAQPAGQIYRVGAEGHDPATLKRGEKAALEAGDFALTLTTGAARREMGSFSGFDFHNALCLGRALFNDRGFGQAPDFSKARFFDCAEFHRSDMHEGARFFQAQFRLDGECMPLEWEALAAELCKRHGLESPPSRAALDDWPDNLQHQRRAYWQAAYKAWSGYWHSACAETVPSQATLFSFSTVYRLPGRVWAWLYPNARKPRHRHLPDADLHEAAYRRLKLIMREIGSHIEEQRFFALELKARQMRTDVAGWERAAAKTFGVVADYGQSAVRPLQWLVGVWAVFAISYTLLASAAGVLPPLPDRPVAEQDRGWVVERPSPLHQIWTNGGPLAQQAGATVGSVFTRYSGPVVFAFEITVVPVANPVRYHTWSTTLNQRPGWSTAFSLMRLLNRMLSVPLLFLTVLSLRRRFQIG